MKAKLAMRLLADLMQWNESQATKEFAWLSLLVNSKYDHYQGYSPGAHFYANLLAWIGQFDVTDRATAYRFLREQLIYVSQKEMHHLVNLTMPVILEEMHLEVASQLKLPYYKAWGDQQAEKRLLLMRLRTLYVGLSDGAKIDVFRRDNEGTVSNEQIVAASEISEKKWEKLIDALRERLEQNGFESEEALFERICLLDDFTASGTTLIRFDKGKWGGKIPTFCEQNNHRFNDDKYKAIAKGCCIHVHHYLATKRAAVTTEEKLSEYRAQNPSFRFSATFSYVLENDIVVSETSSPDLVDLLKRHYDKSIEDDIVGKDIWYGYKQGGLPLVLYHNTPNNSVATLWASSTDRWKEPSPKMKPLFSRKKRHIGHG